jgi:dihydrofolate reductase
MNVITNVIVAHCKNRGIGLKNKIPWHISADLKRFKELTVGDGKNAVIMGRNTWNSLPTEDKPLPKRENIVLTTKCEQTVINRLVNVPHFMPSLKEAIKYCKKQKIEQAWVIGGEMLYKTALDTIDINEIYLTRIDNDFECDTFFPIIPPEFQLISKQTVVRDNDINYQYEKYIFKDVDADLDII